MTQDTETHTIRLKRIRYRSWHRGTREMDFLLGRFADAQLAGLSDRELDWFEDILTQADQDLYNWITAERPWPKALDNPLTHRLTAFALDTPAR